MRRGQPPQRSGPAPAVRKNFADTAFWAASLTTDKDGLAEVTLTMPENLTAWKVKVWAMGDGTRVGQGEAEVVTKKNLLVRLQAPRFFVQKDEVVLSANVHNYLKSDKMVNVSLELEGGTLSATGAMTRQVRIPAGGEQRVDWRVKVTGEGDAIVRMKAVTDEESDAMQMLFPCYVHGMLKTDSFSGVVRPETEVRPCRLPRPGRAPHQRDACWKCATRRRWPAPWSMPCRTWSSIPTAAPSRRSTASCRRSSRSASCKG